MRLYSCSCKYLYTDLVNKYYLSKKISMTKIYAYRNNTSVEIINSTAKPSASCREKKKLKYTILQLLMRGIVFA